MQSSLRVGRHVWAALRPGGSVRLGITADAVKEIGLTREKAFVDLAALESIMVPQRPFAMVEGPLGITQLESPLAGLVVRQRRDLFKVELHLAAGAEPTHLACGAATKSCLSLLHDRGTVRPSALPPQDAPLIHRTAVE